MNRIVCALFAFAICAGVSLAEDIKGKIKSVDAEKNTITVTVEDRVVVRLRIDGDSATALIGNEFTFPIAGDTAFVAGKSNKEVKDRLKAKQLKEGANVTITTENKDGKDVVTRVKLGGKWW